MSDNVPIVEIVSFQSIKAADEHSVKGGHVKQADFIGIESYAFFGVVDDGNSQFFRHL